jgi:hypothetical protein
MTPPQLAVFEDVLLWVFSGRLKSALNSSVHSQEEAFELHSNSMDSPTLGR